MDVLLSSAPPHQQPPAARPDKRRSHRRTTATALLLTRSTKTGLTALALSSLLLLLIWRLANTANTNDNMEAQVIIQQHPIQPQQAFGDKVVGGRNPSHSVWTNAAAPVAAAGNSRMMDTDSENNVFKSANLLAAAVPEHIQKLTAGIEMTESRVQALDLKIYYREAHPPVGHHTKGAIFLLHGQAFTSANWLEKSAIQTFAAAGYRVVAVDLPGYGQTGGRTLSPEEKPKLIEALIEALNLDQPVLVSPSMSGAYSIPYMMSHAHKLSAFIPVAPVSTGDFSAAAYRKIKLPTLIIYGERDTSLGILSASNLKALPNGRVLKLPAAGHACYLNNPDAFHSAVLNFLDLVQSHPAAAAAS